MYKYIYMYMYMHSENVKSNITPTHIYVIIYSLIINVHIHKYFHHCKKWLNQNKLTRYTMIHLVHVRYAYTCIYWAWLRYHTRIQLTFLNLMTICHYKPHTQLINAFNKKVYGYQNMQLFLPLLSVLHILIIKTFNAN